MADDSMVEKKRTVLKRLMLWGLVVGYTLALPEVITAYNAIIANTSVELAGRIPLLLLIIVGMVYMAWVVIKQRKPKKIFILLPCAVIVVTIFILIPDPNKHIHIPEYILMTWLLFAVLSIDYQGKGLYLLILVCAILLGIVDEILQGIHPERFYGWQDMVVNAFASIIGVLTIAGIIGLSNGRWHWVDHLRRLRSYLWLLVPGLMGMAITLVLLYSHRSKEGLYGVYPKWMLVWHCLFIGSALLLWLGNRMVIRIRGTIESAGGQPPVSDELTARLWVLAPLIILVCMHMLVVLAVGSGVPFV